MAHNALGTLILEQLNRRHVQSAAVIENGQLIGMIAVEDLSALND